MSTFRNLFVIFGLGAVVFAFLYAARPQWFAALTARSNNDTRTTAGRAVVVLPIGGRAQVQTGIDVRQLVELEDDGIPLSRVNPYVLVVNTGDRTFHYYQLTSNVKSVSLRSVAQDIVVKTARVQNSQGPLQIEIWTPYARELLLDVEYALAHQ